MNTKHNILKNGIQINLFERDGFETIIGTIVSCDSDGIIVEYKDAMESGFVKLSFNSIKTLEINVITDANSLEHYKIKTKRESVIVSSKDLKEGDKFIYLGYDDKRWLLTATGKRRIGGDFDADIFINEDGNTLYFKDRYGITPVK